MVGNVSTALEGSGGGNRTTPLSIRAGVGVWRTRFKEMSSGILGKRGFVLESVGENLPSGGRVFSSASWISARLRAQVVKFEAEKARQRQSRVVSSSSRPRCHGWHVTIQRVCAEFAGRT